MKKIIFLCFSVIFTNFIWSQTVSVIAPTNVEVGLNNNFQFRFSPISSDLYSGYQILSWQISSGISNMNNSGSPYYNDNSMSNTSMDMGSGSNVFIPIKWEDNSNSTTDVIYITVNVQYREKSSGNWTSTNTYKYSTTKSGAYYLGYDVNIYRIFPPTISSPTILVCCSNNVTIEASSYGNANVFLWYISGATIVSGQGSSVVTISPDPLQAIVTVNCVVSRSNGSIMYLKSKSKALSKTNRTASFTPNYSTTPPYNYICKESGGLQMNMPSQCGISNINWVAPNCTISGQNTLTPTITPTSAIPTGDSIDIFAEVTFTGGCIATTPAVSFKILDSTTAQTPQGYFTATSSNGTSICTAEIFDLTFVSTDGFNNGTTSISPGFLWGPGDPIHYKNGKPTTVTVRNINLCTGLSTSKTFSVYPPAPCASSAKLTSKSKLVTSAKVESTEILATTLIITPNPTNGIIKAMLPDNYSGNYQIFNINGILLQEAKFDNQTELQIELSQKLKSGIYVLKVITETSIFTGKIILNK
jgi:hypothetical protein